MSHPAKNSEIADRVRAGLPLDHIPVIDFHMHLSASSEYYYIPRSAPEYVVQAMDRFGIDHSVTFCVNVTTDPGPGNRLQYAASQAFPRRISALTMLHAAFPQDWLAALEEGGRNGCRGIKLISQYQQGPAETEIDWSPAFDYARDKRWVVLHHHWGSAERLSHWARNFPELIFVVGHAAVAFKHVVSEFDNVYQCTCAAFVASSFSSIESMAGLMPAEKILHGSDALDLDFGTAVGPIAFADLPERKKELILGRNAVSIAERLGWDALPEVSAR